MYPSDFNGFLVLPALAWARMRRALRKPIILGYTYWTDFLFQAIGDVVRGSSHERPYSWYRVPMTDHLLAYIFVWSTELLLYYIVVTIMWASEIRSRIVLYNILIRKELSGKKPMA